jgi:N-acyl-D-aspartate/D-glutamate deacylase
MRTLEKVEGMAYEALSAGLGADWPFITFPDYLDAVERLGSAINVAAYVGHTPMRLFVMGEDATEREATAQEVEQMRSLVREAMGAGAIGFATSQAATHHGAGGKPVPSRLASFSEIDALVGAMAESGRGIMQAAMGRTLFNEEFTDLATRHGVPITWTALLAGMTGPGNHRRYLDKAAEQHDAGLTIMPQVACRPIMFDFHFADAALHGPGFPCEVQERVGRRCEERKRRMGRSNRDFVLSSGSVAGGAAANRGRGGARCRPRRSGSRHVFGNRAHGSIPPRVPQSR